MCFLRLKCDDAYYDYYFLLQAAKEEIGCIPWYLPQYPNEVTTICNPWKTKQFLDKVQVCFCKDIF